MDKRLRLVLVVSILASFVAFLDSAIVNVALPAIQRDLGGGIITQQWVVDAYLLTLGSLILVAGSISDLFGRKRVLAAGLIGFGVTSILCAIAPSAWFLIVARALQGVAGALLVPSSLAMIISAFKGQAQGKAIGTWTAWTGIAFIIGPLVGGFLVDAASWRLTFLINILPIVVTLWLLKSIDLKEEHKKGVKVDFLGAVLCSMGLGGAVFGMIEQPYYGWTNPLIYLPMLASIIILASFFIYESKAKEPMLPLELFKSRNFSVGNIATLAIYAGLSAALFLIILFVQQVGHYSALSAGLTVMPVTLIMFFLSPRFGALAGKYGPRFFMGLGPIVAGCGYLLMLRVTQSVNYWTEFFPGIVLFGIGLSITVAPLTAAILGGIEPKRAGMGSAINNAVARIAGLVAVAVVGAVVATHFGVALESSLKKQGLQISPTVIAESKRETLNVEPPKDIALDPGLYKQSLYDASLSAFRFGVLCMAGLVITGGIISAIGIENPYKKEARNG